MRSHHHRGRQRSVVEDAPTTPDSPIPSTVAPAPFSHSGTTIDLSDGHTASFAPTAGETALGTFSLDTVSEAANAADGSVQWHYALNNGASQYLAAGQSVVEHYTVTVDDGTARPPSRRWPSPSPHRRCGLHHHRGRHRFRRRGRPDHPGPHRFPQRRRHHFLHRRRSQ
ncbi:VCBS domain-containing protein [Mesorhizobium kowhaii]|uniref:VCBS domain-containing protein n=1 Tax=Mesorhizobium kowhaii TaxID=1300272 RepID=UPI003641CC0A